MVIKMESLSKKIWDIDSLTKKIKFILKEIRNHRIHILHWLKTYLKVHQIFDYFI